MMPSLLKSDEASANRIRCILSDVDGVMTNGEITYSSCGDELKTFHVRDGLAVKLWMRSGYPFSIITARKSDLVQRRSEELGITSVYQGQTDKLSAAEEIRNREGLEWDEICYVGDDLPDLPVIRKVGLAVAPGDAAKEVCESAHWIMKSDGGKGVIRECVERLLRAKGRWDEHL